MCLDDVCARERKVSDGLMCSETQKKQTNVFSDRSHGGKFLVCSSYLGGVDGERISQN